MPNFQRWRSFGPHFAFLEFLRCSCLIRWTSVWVTISFLIFFPLQNHEMKKLFCLAIVLLAYAAISAYADSKLQSFTYAVRNRDSADLGNYTAVPKTWNDTISKQFVSLLINTADPPCKFRTGYNLIFLPGVTFEYVYDSLLLDTKKNFLLKLKFQSWNYPKHILNIQPLLLPSPHTQSY